MHAVDAMRMSNVWRYCYYTLPFSASAASCRSAAAIAGFLSFSAFMGLTSKLGTRTHGNSTDPLAALYCGTSALTHSSEGSRVGALIFRVESLRVLYSQPCFFPTAQEPSSPIHHIVAAQVQFESTTRKQFIIF